MGKSGTQLFLLRLLTILLFNPGMPALHELRNLTVLPIIPNSLCPAEDSRTYVQTQGLLGGLLGGLRGQF